MPTADELNNRAVDLFDEGRVDGARELLEQALGRDPLHLHVNYNLGLLRWRMAELRDDRLLDALKEVGRRRRGWIVPLMTAWVHLEQGDEPAARAALGDARKRAAGSTKALALIADATASLGRGFRVGQLPVELPAAAVCLALAGDGRSAISGHRGGWVRVWRVGSAEVVHEMEEPRYFTHDPHNGMALDCSCVDALALTPDRSRVIVGNPDSSLGVWDLSTGECVARLAGSTAFHRAENGPGGHRHGVGSVAITPDGRRAVSGGGFGEIRIWDLATGQPLRALEDGRQYVSSIAIGGDGRTMLAAAGFLGLDDKPIRIWDLETGELLGRLDGHSAEITAVVLTPDARWAVSSSQDRTVRIWDLSARRCHRVLWGHSGHVNNVVVTPDGRRALSISRDQTLRIWEIPSGRCLRTVLVPEGCLSRVAVSPDGGFAIVVGRSAARVELPDALPEAPLLAMAAPSQKIARGRHERWSVAVGRSGRPRTSVG